MRWLTRELRYDQQHLVIQAKTETEARSVAEEHFEECRVQDFYAQVDWVRNFWSRCPEMADKYQLPVFAEYESGSGWGMCGTWPEWVKLVEITGAPVTETYGVDG